MTVRVNSDNFTPEAIDILQNLRPKITSVVYPGDDTAANTAGGQTITINGAGFVTGASVYVDRSPASTTTVVSRSQITFIAPAKASGSYKLRVVNGDGNIAQNITGIQYSGTPTWTTAAGSLGTVTQGSLFSYTVAATSNSAVTYRVASGSIAPGASLIESTGVIWGTARNPVYPTTYIFTIEAIDQENQSTPRDFSILVLP